MTTKCECLRGVLKAAYGFEAFIRIACLANLGTPPARYNSWVTVADGRCLDFIFGHLQAHGTRLNVGPNPA